MYDENVNEGEVEKSGKDLGTTSDFMTDLAKEVIIVTKVTMDRILRTDTKYAGDAITLYMFYSYTANWQGTQQPKSTNSYAMKGLHWTEERVLRAKKILLDLDLIENVKSRNKNNKITGHYIRVKYLPMAQNLAKKPHQGNTTPWDSQAMENPGTNACIQLGKYSKTNNEILPTTSAGVETPPPDRKDQYIVDTITAFREVNHMVERLYGQKHQRAAAATIYKAIGLDEIKKTLRLFSEHKTEKYIPVVTTPVQFADNYEKLKIYLSKDKGKEAYNMKTLQGKHQQSIEIKTLNPFYKRAE
jgi:hypothetical protein